MPAQTNLLTPATETRGQICTLKKTTVKKLKYYIKERHNPQFNRPYYVGMGQLTSTQVRRCENPSYGYNVMHEYETSEEYDAALAVFIQKQTEQDAGTN